MGTDDHSQSSKGGIESQISRAILTMCIEKILLRKVRLPCKISTVARSSRLGVTARLLPAVDIGRLHC